MDITERKNILRTEIRHAAKVLPEMEKQKEDRAIAAHILALPEYAAADTVFAFVGTSREIDTSGVLRHALANGKRLCVPLCVKEGQMQLKQIQSLEELRPGAYGILEPSLSAPTLQPQQVDFALIPCLSCSLTGERLGQGGGYYDRFMETYTGKAALLCREKFICSNIPMETHDARVPIVITEKGVYRNGTLCSRSERQ